MRSKPLILLILAVSLCTCVGAYGQTQPNSAQAPSQQSLPFTTHLKKTVVFITTNCVKLPSEEELAAMTPQDSARWTDEGISKLKPEELAKLRQTSHFGTGFVVLFPDDRLGKDMGFKYLVTNRHVVQPGIEDGRPCKVVNYSFSVNHFGTPADRTPHLESFHEGPEGVWVFPQDGSVDLAATQFGLSNDEYDFKTVTTTQFVTQEMIEKNEVVEGDPVIFTGLFIQYSGLMTRLEPVVRSGAIAMLPEDLILTTLHRLGHAYLADVHAFGGNSGSPMFVDINRFRSGVGYDYRFLGVVTGEIQETADLTLHVITTYEGKISANSDVSVIVPAFEVKNLLMSAPFQQIRDAYVASHPAPQPTNEQPASSPPAK
jgi:hypothetical protein